LERQRLKIFDPENAMRQQALAGTGAQIQRDAKNGSVSAVAVGD
jgi:hypothetical protein